MNLSSRTLFLRALPARQHYRLGGFIAWLLYLALAQKAIAAPLLPAGTPVSWVETAVSKELLIINDSGNLPLRYRIHKVDSHSDTVRIQIESRQGDVARLIERNGHALTPTEDEAEKARLQAILTSPADFIRHHKRDASTRADVTDLVKLLPQAELYAYAPDQPQLPGIPGPQVVIDFHPNPAFHPPTMLADSLTGIEGRVWIDAASQRMVRIEGRFLKTVNFGYGIVARIYPGGSIELEQVNAGQNRWVFSHLVEHLTVRAMMVKTIPEDNQMTATEFHLLPGPVDFQEVVHELLALPIPTQ